METRVSKQTDCCVALQCNVKRVICAIQHHKYGLSIHGSLENNLSNVLNFFLYHPETSKLEIKGTKHETQF